MLRSRHRSRLFFFDGFTLFAGTWFAGLVTEQLFFGSPAMLPATTRRVRVNTCESVNQQIRRRTQENVTRATAGGRTAIERRLSELDDEWDIERFVETMTPTFTLLGLALGLARHRAWFALPVVVQGFFLQHALQGWCPPIPVLRRLGIRTLDEIEEERFALKALRGDFRKVATSPPNIAAGDALRAAQS
jgi:hypothetical protein